MIPWLHHASGIVCEPVDVAVNKRHLDMKLAHIVNGDRPLFGALIGSERPGFCIPVEDDRRS